MAAITQGPSGGPVSHLRLERARHQHQMRSNASLRVQSLVRCVFAVVIALLGLVSAPGAHSLPFRVYLSAHSETFNLVAWEGRHLKDHGVALVSSMMHAPESDVEELYRIREYLQAPRSSQADQRWDIERAIERQLAAVIMAQDIGNSLSLPVPGLFPPVAFRFTAPPSVLIVSPRDRLVVQQSLFLSPGVSGATIGEVEARVAGLGVSPLITPIGGLATYPAMVVESARPSDALASVAHEWAHAHLAFRPLGASYWSSQEGRAINETVADLVGRELGADLSDRVGLPAPTERMSASGDDVFRREMRATRAEVERLLASGEVDAAEAYMEQRRQELSALGYRIRRLNQAYFAFHGSYAESSAGDDRIGSLVRGLRSRSSSLASFVARVGEVQSVDELRKLGGAT
ncbi:MAG: hypothetical protein ACKVVP_22925 [Chloroflexota bacterium]